MATLILLILLDGYLTYRVLKQGGRELNPVLLKFSELTDNWLILSRVSGVALAVLLWFLGGLFMDVLCAVYGAVCYHNYRELGGTSWLKN